MLKQIVFGSFYHPFQDGYKSSVIQILFPWLAKGDTWTAFRSIFCMPEQLPNVGVLLACFLTDAQISNS